MNSSHYLTDLPHSLESENAIVGAILLDNSLIEQTSELTIDDFYLETTRRIFAAMRELDQRGSEINAILIGEQLKQSGGNLDDFGGVAGIANLIHGLPVFDSITSYVELILRKSLERQQLELATRFARQLASGANGDAQQTFVELYEIRTQLCKRDGAGIGSSLAVSSLFVAKSANEWITEAMQRPVPQMLFGELWFESEVCILFSETNAGKTLFAVQLAESICRRQPQGAFALTAAAQTVLYFDFELSDKQFARRYSIVEADKFINPYEFSDNFFRVEINPQHTPPRSFATVEQFLQFSLEQKIVETDARVLIIDNITWLIADSQKGVEATALMKYLQTLQAKYDLSLLVLAHTPKRDETRPLSLNDLGGSRRLADFADSIFAIGKSNKDAGFRYLKQLKTRNGELRYNAENVCLCQISKANRNNADGNFTRFEFLDFTSEAEHLKTPSESDRQDKVVLIKQLKAQGSTQREIANELNISLGTVNNYLRK